MTQETAGKIYSDLQQKQQDKITVFEMQEALQENYIEELCALVEKDKLRADGDLYVEVIVFKHPLMEKAFRRYMKSRTTCPTPFYDQSVFHYSKKDDKLEYLWHIPDMDTCHELMSDPLNLPSDEKELLKHVLDFKDGTLLRQAKKLNGEINDLNLEFFRLDNEEEAKIWKTNCTQS